MSRLLMQADDNGISTATALGVLDALRGGIVRNTGLFTNMPAAARAAADLRGFPDISVGLDVNFVTGIPISSAADVPTLVHDDGAFRSSHDVRGRHQTIKQDGHVTIFATEPFPYHEAIIEGRAQLARFSELMGRQPAYIHHHALVTPTTDRVVTELATELNVPVPMQLAMRRAVVPLPNPWYTNPFPLDAQARVDAITPTIAALEELRNDDIGLLITHPGYVDAELLNLSSFSVVRVRDLDMLRSAALRDAIARLAIELVSYGDIAPVIFDPVCSGSVTSSNGASA